MESLTKTEHDKLLIHYWEKQNRHYKTNQRYTEWVFKKMVNLYCPDMKEKRILDIGCGYGAILSYYWDKGAKADGLEIVKEIVDYYTGWQEGKIYYGDCRDCKQIPSNKYDFVSSLGVIEHFPEWRKAIKEHFRILKPGGRVLISVPWKYSPVYYMMGAWFIKDVLKYGRMIANGAGYSKSEIVAEMEKYGEVVGSGVSDFCAVLQPFGFKEAWAEKWERHLAPFGVMLFVVGEK